MKHTPDPESRAVCHFITGEYPPQIGGVSDYTRQIAQGIAAQGYPCVVWAPAYGSEPSQSEENGVSIRRELGAFRPADLRAADAALNSWPSPRRLLVQWVPHSFGYLSMNIFFCLWLWRRSRLGDRVELMVHEPFLMFSQGTWKQDAAAAIHRVMIRILLRTASRVWCAIPEWETLLKPHAPVPGPEFKWLPIPSSIPTDGSGESIPELRNRLLHPGRILIGHFGTYNRPVTEWLLCNLPSWLELQPAAHMVFLGHNSLEFHARLTELHPGLSSRVSATGALPAESLSDHIQACDILLQPYPAGMNSRQSSGMACLAHGKPVVTTLGRVSEPLWQQSSAVVTGDFMEPQSVLEQLTILCGDSQARQILGERAAELYQRRFAADHTIRALVNACA